jgi:hypothetical protein
MAYFRPFRPFIRWTLGVSVPGFFRFRLRSKDASHTLRRHLERLSLVRCLVALPFVDFSARIQAPCLSSLASSAFEDPLTLLVTLQ